MNLHANIKFYDIPSETAEEIDIRTDLPDRKELLSLVCQSVIGKDKTFSGPFGLRKVEYCDYTASGRSLSFLEDYIRDQVLPDYGNTHTTTTVTSLQTTLFRHEARDIVRNTTNASEHDAVIFTGSGCTGAVHKLIHALDFKEPPIVFVGPYEHHSNLLPWRELGSTVIQIIETGEGLVDLNDLRVQLQKWDGSDRQLVGCFSAASNITGIMADVNAITITFHKHGALAFWDYATAGPYVNVDMNPVVNSEDQPFVYKDALFIATHKFVGGIQTPGILVAKKNLFRNRVPSGCGGGSVFFVRREEHRYLQEAEMREEGGTPAIVESIRAGLVFQLKDAISPSIIMEREHKLCRNAMEVWKPLNEKLILLGSTDVPRLPIFSFIIRHSSSGLYLHHNFVCAVLNDVFGIQARGGCACAGPYAEELLGIDESLAKKIEDVLVEDSRLDRVHLRRYREYSQTEILRPGFTRLNFPYFMSDEAADFVVKSVAMVAEHGWKLLPQYKFNPETGEWRHRNHQVFKDRKWLGYIVYKAGKMTWKDPPCAIKGPLPENYQDCLNKATRIFEQANKFRVELGDQTLLFDETSSKLRWFLLPSESHSNSGQIKQTPPFTPLTYPRIKPVTSRTVIIAEPFVGIGNVSSPNEARQYDLAKLSKKSFQKEMLSSLSEGFSENDNDGELAEGAGTTASDSVETKSFNIPGENTHAGTKSSASKSDYKRSHKKGFCGDGSEIKVVKLDTASSSSVSVNSTTHQSTDHNDSRIGASGINSTDNKRFVCEGNACFTKRTGNVSDSPRLPVIKYRWHNPPKHIFKPTVQAVEDFDMIKDGDKVLVCLSGGKDSLSLLHTLHQMHFYLRKKDINFELGAVTIDPQTSAYDPSPLKGYLKQLNVPYYYEEQNILEAASNIQVDSICSFCSRMKRGRIYHAARRENFNVLAMGQHLDDLSESFLMSIFQNGILRTMKANYTVREGDLRVIRPFVYVREKHLRQFAEEKKLPVIAENCPACFEAPKERHRMKQLLASQEVLHGHLFPCILNAIRPIMAISKTGVNAKAILAQFASNGNESDED